MSVQVDVAVGPWLDQDSCLDDGLLAQLAVELGGNPTPPASLPASFAPAPGQVPAEQHLQYSAAGTQQHGRLPLSHAASLPAGGGDGAPNALLPQNSINQSMALPFGFGCNLQQLRTSGSLPAGLVHSLTNPQQQQQQQGLPGALNSASSLPFAPSSLLQSHIQPLLMFSSALGGLMSGGAADVRPAASKSQSPTTSSGCQQGGEQDSLDHSEAARASKTLNKGALAQKRFRERQKVRHGHHTPFCLSFFFDVWLQLTWQYSQELMKKHAASNQLPLDSSCICPDTLPLLLNTPPPPALFTQHRHSTARHTQLCHLFCL